MNASRMTPGVLSGLLFTAALLADEPAEPPTTAQPVTSRSASLASDADRANKPMRLFLMENSMVSGKLSTESVTVETAFGRLEIPVTSIVSFTPGLDSHPDERKRIARLIQQLGSNSAAERDTAQKTLSDLGLSIQAELGRYINDEDAERRSRVQKILAEFEEFDPEDLDPAIARPWIAQDTVETTLFTVVGTVAPRAFVIQTQFGPLNVSISDIRRGEREPDQKPEIRKTVVVRGENLVQLTLANSGVRLNRGDKVSISADGKLVMTPWGNNETSSPDGNERYQWFIPGQIPGGALVARIGTGGKVFKVGSKNTFTASRTGVLYFGIAMNAQFATQDYNYGGEYNVKVKVNAK